MSFEKRLDINLSDYLDMIKGKTGALLGCAGYLGGLIATDSPQKATIFKCLGETLGSAFQIQDDLLDTYSDVSVFGKKTGNDILTGKKTFLLINALQKSKPKISEKLKILIKNKDISDEEKIYSVTNIYNFLKIKELTEMTIKGYHQKALKYLEDISCEDGRKKELLNFASQIMQRDK